MSQQTRRQVLALGGAGLVTGIFGVALTTDNASAQVDAENFDVESDEIEGAPEEVMLKTDVTVAWEASRGFDSLVTRLEANEKRIDFQTEDNLERDGEVTHTLSGDLLEDEALSENEVSPEGDTKTPSVDLEIRATFSNGDETVLEETLTETKELTIKDGQLEIDAGVDAEGEISMA